MILEIQLDSGVFALIPRIAFGREEAGLCTAFPTDIGYAVTVDKLQRETLEHQADVYTDANAPGAGYVEVSRVRKVEDLFWYGLPTSECSKPANRTDLVAFT